MSATVSITVKPTGRVIVGAREVLAIDTKDSIIERETKGAFVQESVPNLGVTIEKIAGYTVVRRTKL
jgi:hypothetical protein